MKTFSIAIVLFFSATINAATVFYSSPGVVTAIGGLEIGGIFYNVDFETDFAAGGPYSTFGGDTTFWDTATERDIAATAVRAVLNSESSIPTEVNNSYSTEFAVYSGSVGRNNRFTAGSWVDAGCCTLNQSRATAWSVVPIPAAAWLFASGLLGLIAAKKRN